MAATTTTIIPDYDRATEIRAFDDTKAGVKGLVDAGATNIPQMFHRISADTIAAQSSGLDSTTKPSIPLIDLQASDRDKIVEQVRDASQTFGFFQVVNHGIPTAVLEEIKNGTRRFFEQDLEEKKEFYSRDFSKRFFYNSNFDLYSAPSANWRDTFSVHMFPDTPNSDQLPAVCRCVVAGTLSVLRASCPPAGQFN